MSILPTGYVTFLFTDVEGSTRLFQQHPEEMKGALGRHTALLQDVVRAHGGDVFNVVGDGLCSVFVNASDAIAAAIAGQRAMFAEPWSVGALRVRMGLHTGIVESDDAGYVSSLTLARTQRVATAGHGGQTLLSQSAADAVRAELPPGTTLRDLGAHKLRGITEPETICELVCADLPSEFPPLRAESSTTAPLAQLVRGQLVGRPGEQQHLRALWNSTQQARGHLALLSGEPGVGKTRLAQDLVAHAQQAGAVVLRGGCYEYEATAPYLPFIEAIREWTRRQSPAQLRAALGDTASEIAKFAPEIVSKLGALPANPALPPAEERLRLFDHTARFVAGLAARSGLLLFVDDLHWADQGTLSLLHYLLRHLRNDRVLVLAAYREVELDRAHPLADALVEWTRERLATRVQLGRLSRADTATLLAALFGMQSVSDEFVDALFRETEGNPFFVEEVVKSLIEQGQIYREGSGWARKDTHELTLPQSVKEAIGRRLNRLADGTVDVLRTAAALGKRFRFRELAAATTIGEDGLLDALDEAGAAQLVRVDGGSAKAGDDGFAFTHDKIREVLNEEVNPIRRRRLHQRIGEALELLYGLNADSLGKSDDEHAQDLAHHFMQAGDLVRSLVYALRAAGKAERLFALDEALQFLEQARESAETLERDDALPAIDHRMGDIHNQRGTMLSAVASYQRALGGIAGTLQRAALKAKIGSSYCAVGDPRGLPYLDQALAELDPATQTNELALATALMGRYYHYRTEHRRALVLLEQARALAAPLDDPFTLSLIQIYLAGAHQHLLEFEASDRWSRMNIALGERTQFSFAKASGYEFLGENAANRGYWNDALGFAAKDDEEGTRSGSLARKAWAQFCVAQALLGKGEIRQARQVAEGALTLADRIGESRLATWLGPVIACACADLGDDDAALAAAERNFTRARELDQLLLSAWALHALGYAATMRGDHEASIRWYGEYVPLVADTENGIARLIILPDCAEAFFRAGRFDEAGRLAERAIAVADIAGAAHRRAIGRRTQARLLAQRGDIEGAMAACGEALAIFHEFEGRLEWARTLALRADLAPGQGFDARAKEDLVLARTTFAELGAARDEQLALQRLKERG